MGGASAGSSSLVAKCIPVFVKVRRCIYSPGYPHTTTITLSSIVVSDFLPPLVMTSLLEQAPDWLTRRKYPPNFRFFNSRKKRSIAPQDCLLRLCIDLTCKSFAPGVNAPLFWRHPFTAEEPLVNKWCNATFLQIWWRKTHLHLKWLRVNKCSVPLRKTINLTVTKEQRLIIPADSYRTTDFCLASLRCSGNLIKHFLVRTNLKAAPN